VELWIENKEKRGEGSAEVQPERREAPSRNAERLSTRVCSPPFRLWPYAINLRRTMRRNPRAGRIHHALTLIWKISLAGEPRHKE
jgi:hypothetical protein